MEKIEPKIKKLIILSITLLVIAFILMIIIGTIYNSMNPNRINNEQKDIPHYTIADEEDLSYSNVIRWQIRATTPIDNLTQEQIKNIAGDIVKRVKEERKVNAISIFLYYEGDDIYYMYTIARIDYAPYGDWSRADEVKTGDYSKHKYSIEYRNS